MTPQEVKTICEARDNGLRIERLITVGPFTGRWLHDPEPMPEHFPDDQYRVHPDDVPKIKTLGP